MCNPKHNYDSEEFYKLIEQLAMNGYTDSEIANELSLSVSGFSAMKNGIYHCWDDEQNKTRGARIVEVLERGRVKINALVRSRYLKMALGGIKVKSVSTTRRKVLDGSSELGDEVVQTVESEQELGPNHQALSVWLYHHDKSWRDIEQGKNNDDIDELDIEEDKWLLSNSNAEDKDSGDIQSSVHE